MNIKPRVSQVFGRQFPRNYTNSISGWGCFDRIPIEVNKGKLLSLDIDFGRKCSLNCPHCFRRSNPVDTEENDLSYDEICQVIIEAKKLGLKTVKFLGAGDPLEAPRILKFLLFLQEQKITPAIFTKGHVIGDNNLCHQYFPSMKSGADLAHFLRALGVSIILGFNSFDPAIQDTMVGGMQGFTQKRNRALEILVSYGGFNRPLPTQLAIAVNPVIHTNLDEVFEIYQWARKRNIYCVVCPTMVSGRCRNDWQKITPSEDQLVELYTKIYRWNITRGLQTLEQIKREGIAAYAGGQPCNQVACGMYVTLTGTVLRCPGDDITVLGNIRNQPLAEIWYNSENYRRAGTYNCGCPPKMGKSIPSRLFERVMNNLF